tara:strand:- start:290 stop:505 length:216 start_codon:yes stop_codon:yes gene_type:complete
MKILPSSPYAVFNAKEWDSLQNVNVNRRKRFYKVSNSNLPNYYCKNLNKYNVKNSVQNQNKKNKFIQLSFA